MEVKDAHKEKLNLEMSLYEKFLKFEEETGLQIAAVLLDRADVSQMGDDESNKSKIVGIEVVAGLDVPPTPKEGR